MNGGSNVDLDVDTAGVGESDLESLCSANGGTGGRYETGKERMRSCEFLGAETVEYMLSASIDFLPNLLRLGRLHDLRPEGVLDSLGTVAVVGTSASCPGGE